MRVLYEKGADRYHFFEYHNMNFPVHLHAELEILWVEQGEIEVVVGNQSQNVSSGELVIVFPHQIHSYRTTPGIDNCGILTLFPPSSFGEFKNMLVQYHPVTPFLPGKGIHPDIRYCLKNIVKISDVQSSLPVVKAYIHLILAHLIPHLSCEKNRDNQSLDTTVRLVEYVSDHFREPITLQTLAEYLNVSRYSVSRIFSEKLNTSFSSYINTLRIDHAKKLLAATDSGILCISECCGYDTLRTFNREFQAHCHCSPREYRKQMGVNVNTSTDIDIP